MISVGQITNSVRGIDLSLEVKDVLWRTSS